MTKSWEIVSVQEIGAEFGDAPFGTNLKTKDYVAEGVPVIQGRNIKNNRFEWNHQLYVTEEKFRSLPKSYCREGDLIFPKVGTIGILAIMPKVENREVCLLSTNMMKMSVDPKKADSRYVYYFFSQEWVKKFIRTNAGGSSQPIFNFTTLKAFKLPLPDLPTQRKIAGILSVYDDLIENNLRRIKILENMAQSLYREWFVHFRFPGHESAKFVDSAFGQIPKGWAVKKLEQILELKYGKALKKEDRREGQYSVFGSSGIVGTHDISLTNGPGIVVGRKGNVGSVFWSDEDFFVIDTAYFVESRMPLRFLFYLLPTLNFINSDAAVPGLSRQQAYSLEVVVPPSDLLSRFCAVADDFERQASIHRRRNQALRLTRDLLLPKLLSPRSEHAL